MRQPDSGVLGGKGDAELDRRQRQGRGLSIGLLLLNALICSRPRLIVGADFQLIGPVAQQMLLDGLTVWVSIAPSR